MQSQEKHQESTVVLILVMFTSFITPFIGSAINLALPMIAHEFGLNAITMSWVTMAFLLSSAVFLVPLGKLADIFGRKRVFLTGNVVLALASLLAVFVPNGATLIALRVVQGIGSAMMFATGIALITSVFPPNARGRAIGMNVTAVYVGLSAAPVLGGLMIDALGWRSLFYIPALLGIPAVIAAILTIKGEWAEAKGEKFDILGSGIFIVSMCALMYGFSKLPSTVAIVLTAVGLLGLALFVKLQMKLEYPVFNVSLFRVNRLFALSNLAALINYATTFAITFVLSLYLQYIKGLSAREAGLLLVIQPLVMAVIASWSGRLSDKHDPRILASAGMGVIAVGLALLIPISKETAVTYIGVVLGILGLGFGMFSSPNTNAIMGSVEKRYIGLASGTVATMRLVGQMLSMGIATMVIHVFIGTGTINASNHKQFILSASVTFAIFVALSVLGVWASLARGGKNGNQA
ncbi:MFS transporter [Tenuifilum osseticum]|uniref:MFS transporter n=1 Tax=Tenuifilum osseticum TaxID=3374723 RepID=UPI0034E54E53